MASGQKQRKQKISNGVNRGAKKLSTPLTETQKVNLGGGMLVGLPKRWKQQS